MNIGIDAKWYFEGPPSGRRVIQNIVNELLNRNLSHNIYVILDKKYKNEKDYFIRRNVTPVFVWANNNLISNLFFLPILAKRYSIDLIIYQNFSALWGKHKKIAYIHDILFLIHPQFYSGIEKLYFLPLRFLANRSDSIITVSETEKERILSRGFKKQVFYVHHGVSSNFKEKKYFSIKLLENVIKKYNLPLKYILYVGRLNKRKNIINLLKAIALLDIEIKLVIIGEESWKTDDLDKQINLLNIKERVLFTGSVFDEDLYILFTLAELFVFPSYAEAFGLPPLEAMASGIPIIVSNRTSIPEICGDAGYYVDPDSPEEIANQIILALNDEQLRKKRIEIGLKRAKYFTWEKSVDKILSICEKVYYES